MDLLAEFSKRLQGVKALLPKQAFNPVGSVGGLIQNLNKVTTSSPMGALKIGVKLGGLGGGSVGGVIDAYQTAYDGSVQQNQLGGLLSPAGAAYGMGRMLTGGPFSPLPKIAGIIQQAPKGKIADTIGKNYTVGNIEYDYKTGRAINPPRTTFVPARSAAPPDNSGFIEIDDNTNNRRPDNFSSPRNTEAERRAYLSELSSVAQQTTQNPLLNQYYALRKPDPRAAEDLGMQMFALANPELAKKVRPGQAGYDVIQRVYPQATTAATLPPPVDPTGLTEEERQAIANQMFYNQY